MQTVLSSIAARVREQIRRSSPVETSFDNAHETVSDPEFGELALELFHAQLAASPAYRAIIQTRGLRPESVRDWRDIPAVPTRAFKELEVTCLPPAERTAVFCSSGTTAQSRSRHWHSPESLTLYEASLLAWFQWNIGTLATPGRLLALTPPPELAPQSSLVHMFDVLLRESTRRDALPAQRAAGVPPAVLSTPASGEVTAAGGCRALPAGRQQHVAGVHPAHAVQMRPAQFANESFFGCLNSDGAWELDFARLATALAEARADDTPVTLLGTAFNFVHWLDWLAARGETMALPTGSCILETGGYKGRSRELPRAELHAELARQLVLPPARIFTEYGMSELSSQAYETIDPVSGTQSFRFPPWARAVVVSPETGREVADDGGGLLRVMDLANVWSVLAVQTEDLALRRGAGFELLGRAVAAEPRGCSLLAA